jgi:indolepyruvate ferredoxin oxidoreductase beta subunit
LSFDKVEALRNQGILTRSGRAIVNDLYLVPVTVSSGQQKNPEGLDEEVAKAFGKNLFMLDASKIATEQVGNIRTMNMVLAGALSNFCPIKEEIWYEAMAQLLSGPKAKLLEINKKAFELGRKAV